MPSFRILACTLSAIVALSTTSANAEDEEYLQSIVKIDPASARVQPFADIILKIFNLNMSLFQSIGGGEKVDTAKHIEMAKEAVRDKLIDPSSAEFYDLAEHGNGSLTYVCGEVNAKNLYGGYTGKKQFISFGPMAEILSADRDMKAAAFLHVWMELCLNPEYLDKNES